MSVGNEGAFLFHVVTRQTGISNGHFSHGTPALNAKLQVSRGHRLAAPDARFCAVLADCAVRTTEWY
eukprot:890342-Rhodomonas_salina.1